MSFAYKGWEFVLTHHFDIRKEMIGVAIDPICKMEVDEKTAKLTSEYGGKKYYFCAPGCKKAFEENPKKYAKK